MPFIDISDYLANSVGNPVATFLTNKYGRSGYKEEMEIHPQVQWRPTIQIKTNRFSLLGVDVSEQLYPAAIKIASHDLRMNCNELPVSVAIACPLVIYQQDKNLDISNQLRKDGIGLITVDDNGLAVEQFCPVPVIHHITRAELDTRTTNLSNAVRVKVYAAFDVYRTNAYQGLQDTGQLVEAIIVGFATDAKKNGWISSFNTSAEALDKLYSSTEKLLQNQRAALGGARDFMSNFRNLSSHPPKSAKDVARLITSCRDGFLSATRVSDNLCGAVQKCGLRVRLKLP